ncbi:MAG: hypothetical protein O2798_06270 [Chloroflexi bacterium]|nr:hypothetical protein [Chloroflexota bacterium]MDA1240435.1 hypothetical protein [Chloroflexota bacterium]
MLIFAGTGSIISAVLVFLRVPVVVALAVGVVILVACTGVMIEDLRGRGQ